MVYRVSRYLKVLDMRKIWTKDEVRLLIDMVTLGTTWDDLTYVFKRTKSSIKNKLEKQGYSTKDIK